MGKWQEAWRARQGAGSGPAAGTHRQSEEQKENENDNETAFCAGWASVFICEKIKYSEEKKKHKYVTQGTKETHGYAKRQGVKEPSDEEIMTG